MTLEADLFFSFRSPYSYLAVGRYRQMCETYDLAITLRTVLPIAVRDPAILFKGNRAAPRYILMDCMRAGEYLGIPIRWPRPDPIVQDFATGEIAKDQPYIFRLCRLGQAATRRGKGLAFAAEVAALIWDGSTQNWHEGDHLAGAASRAGLDFADLEAEAARDAAALDAEIAENQAALEAAGHWGVPTLVFEGEPFFGQDRVEMAQWRMAQKGLSPRAKPSSQWSEDDVRRHIQREYDRAGYTLGWSYVASSRSSRERPGLVTIGLNPGGGKGQYDWANTCHLIYPDGEECINAYLDEDWTDGNGPTALQSQIKYMKDKYFPNISPEEMLSFQLVPFRSPSWEDLPPERSGCAIDLGFDLLDWTLANLTNESTVVAFGLSSVEYRLAEWFDASERETFKAGWGNVTARVWNTPKARKLIFLPHLSRYKILGRPEFVEEARVFG